MIRFGPAGNSDSFYEEGYKRTSQAPKWCRDKGLSAFEYSFGRGMSLSETTGASIRIEAQKYDVAMSAHAVYFINLAADDEERIGKNIEYFLECAKGASFLGADRLVFHPGAVKGSERCGAMKAAMALFGRVINILDEYGYSDIALCPETMGKAGQLGDLGEVLELCGLDERIVPAIDFGHLHARGCGAINGKHDYEVIVKEMIDRIGFERTNNMHIHFSKIEFTKAGERRHRIFADSGFGPDFEPLMQVIYENKLEPRIICESKGTMAEDAKMMSEYYYALGE